MLADPRRKQKLSADPRNLAWKNDQNKIATKLMEKMGWTEGKGLGANSTGNLEPIKVQLKGDNRGVGCTRNYADNWIAHQDDFNSLLANLNSSGSTETSGYGSDPEPRRVQKLEEKGRSSKGRVHYMKFAKGKDLSAKSSEDMACIFGKRKSKSAPVTPQTQSEANSEDEDAGVEENKAEVDSGIQTFTSGTSVQDYFAKKLAALKSGGSSQGTVQRVEEVDMEPRSGFGFGFVAASADTADVPQEQTLDKPKKKKKKEKRRKEDEERLKEDSDSSPSPVEEPEASVESSEKPRKKKKKDKKLKDKEKESKEQDSDTVVSPLEEEKTEERSPKKKKSKKRKKAEEAKTEADINEEISKEQDSDTPASPQEDESEEQPSKRKKKSKKRRAEEAEKNSDDDSKDDGEGSTGSADDETLTKNAKKRKLEKQTIPKTADVNENLDSCSVLEWKREHDMGFKGSSFVDIKGYGHGFDTSLTVMPMSETRKVKIIKAKRKK